MWKWQYTTLYIDVRIGISWQGIMACTALHTCCKTYSLIIKVCICQMLLLLLKSHKSIEFPRLRYFDDFENLIGRPRPWTEPLWLAPSGQNQSGAVHESRHLLHFRSHASLTAHLKFLTDSQSCCLWSAAIVAVPPVTDALTDRIWFAVIFWAEWQPAGRLLVERILSLDGKCSSVSDMINFAWANSLNHVICHVVIEIMPKRTCHSHPVIVFG